MSKNPLPPLTVADVLASVHAELDKPAPPMSPTARRFAQVRKLMDRARAPQFLGRLTFFKRVLHRLNRPMIARQHDINEAQLKLIEDLYDQFGAYKGTQNQIYRDFFENLVRTVTVDGGYCDHPATEAPPSPAKLETIWPAPAAMLVPERLLLYSLILGLRPQLCLEIGSFRGGSSAIICAALDDAGGGRLVCVDPEPRMADDLWQAIAHRAVMYTGPSPHVLADVARAEGSSFDFAFIDGDHQRQAVLADIEAVLPLLADGAYLLFHDCHFSEVASAISEALSNYPQQLQDCGVLSVLATGHPEDLPEGVEMPAWGGLRLLRFREKPG